MPTRINWRNDRAVSERQLSGLTSPAEPSGAVFQPSQDDPSVLGLPSMRLHFARFRCVCACVCVPCAIFFFSLRLEYFMRACFVRISPHLNVFFCFCFFYFSDVYAISGTLFGESNLNWRGNFWAGGGRRRVGKTGLRLFSESRQRKEPKVKWKCR